DVFFDIEAVDDRVLVPEILYQHAAAPSTRCAPSLRMARRPTGVARTLPRDALNSGEAALAVSSASLSEANSRETVALSVVVLAAGQGKRMHSALPKVLQPIAGRPMLAHVLDAARAAEPAAIHVVYGHGGDAVREAFAGIELQWAHQAQQ